MERKTLFGIAVGVLVGVSLGINILAMTGAVEFRPELPTGNGLPLGSKLPVVEGIDILTNTRQTIDLLGSPAIVYAALSGCPHCAQWTPKLVEAASVTNTPVVILGVGDHEILKAELTEFDAIGAPIIAADNELIQRLDIGGFPFTYLVNANGEIVEKWRGNSPNVKAEHLELSIRNHL